MDKEPHIFIGSSREGLPIAEEVFAQFNRTTRPRLWKHNIFTPGGYTMEDLEEEIQKNDFAVFIASPDDIVLKREESSASIRDNVILEFGMSIGRLGRKRSFIIIPDSPKVAIPSNLYGITIAEYNGSRIKDGIAEIAAAVQEPCRQILYKISEEWQVINKNNCQSEIITPSIAPRSGFRSNLAEQTVASSMKQKISIIGAAGDVGKQIVNRLILSNLVSTHDTLQLIEEKRKIDQLKGLATDFVDAYASNMPNLEITCNPKDINGDIIIMVAGKANEKVSESRFDLAKFNRPLLQNYAQEINVRGHEFIIIVTNPVELGVYIFATKSRFKPNKIIGIGAFQDSLRFQREIAFSLNLPRNYISAFVIGLHNSPHMIPLWSSLRIKGKSNDELEEIKAKLISKRSNNKSYFELVKEEVKRVNHKVHSEGGAAKVFEYVENLPPDIRIQVKPRLLQDTGSKSAFSTSNVTFRLIEYILKGRNIVISGQIYAKPGKSFTDVSDPVPFGLPILITPTGWEKFNISEPNEQEKMNIKISVNKILECLDEWRKELEDNI